MRALLAIICLLASFASSATTYYVNNLTGSDSNDGKAAAVGGGHGPWLTIHCTALQAGDTENVAFTGMDYGSIFCSNKAASSGTPSAPITITGPIPGSATDAHGQLPRIRVSSGQAIQLRDNVSYMVLQYLDAYVTSTSGAGFLIGSSGYAGTVHHILVQHSRVSYAGGDCYSMEFADYTTFLDNEALNCGQLDTGASDSGISILAPTVAAGDDGLLHGCYGLPQDMVARYGTSYRNCVVRNRVWYTFKGNVASDGNGIIFDDWPCTQFPVSNCLGVNYPYAGLIAENCIYSTDGRSAHCYLINTSAGTTRVAYNTSYNACRGGAPCGATSGAIDALGTVSHSVTGVQFDHNIVYAPTGSYGIDISNATGGTFIVCANDLYGGLGGLHSDGSAASITQAGNITLDPHLVNPTASQITTDFRSTSLTPATTGC